MKRRKAIFSLIVPSSVLDYTNVDLNTCMCTFFSRACFFGVTKHYTGRHRVSWTVTISEKYLHITTEMLLKMTKLLQNQRKLWDSRGYIACIHLLDLWLVCRWKLLKWLFEIFFESSFQYYMCSVTRQLNKHQITGCLYRLLTNFKLK